MYNTRLNIERGNISYISLSLCRFSPSNLKTSCYLSIIPWQKLLCVQTTVSKWHTRAKASIRKQIPVAPALNKNTQNILYISMNSTKKQQSILRSNILLDNPKKHGGHEFFLFATYNQIQVLHCFSREKAVDKRAEQMRMGPLHHIKTLLQYPQLLLLAQLHSLHQWQYISFLLLEVLFTMLLLAHWNNPNYSVPLKTSRHLSR